MPKRHTRVGPKPEITVSPKTTSPEVGDIAPEMTLNRVVFPAPLGPMIPVIVFSSTWRSILNSASIPPKALEILLHANNAVTGFSP